MSDRRDAGIVRQAGCVAIGERGLLIEGPPGSGKSSLALALIDRGAVLVGDDGIVLSRHGERLWAAPHPATRGLLEVRNLGIMAFPVAARVRICLMLVFDRAAPRYVDEALRQDVAGAAIPALQIWPHSPELALRAELAMRRYGLA